MKQENRISVVLRQRSLFTLGVICIYLFGNHIPIVTTNFTNHLPLAELFKYTNEFIGANLSRATLFSLGLGPWMSTMLIWQVLMNIKSLQLRKKPKKTLDRLQMILVLFIGIIQGFGVVLTFGQKQSLLENSVSVILLLGGLFFLIWLGNMNSVYGIGNFTVFIVVGMLRSMLTNILSYYNYIINLELMALGILVLIILFIIISMVVVNLAELRLPIERSMLYGEKEVHNYIAFRLNTSGGMAIMYAMTLFVLPQYVFQLVLYAFPQSLDLQVLKYFSLNNIYGISWYCILLFALSIGFAFLMIDPERMAENLAYAGDYFEDIVVGEPTRKYIQNRLLYISIVGGIFTMIIAGFPLYIALNNPELLMLCMIPGTLFVFISLMVSVVEQITVFSFSKVYHSLI